MDRKRLGVALTLVGILANLLGIAAFFGLSGARWWPWLLANPFWLIGSTGVLALGLSIHQTQRYRVRVEGYRQQLDTSQQNVRALLDMLYSDPRFQLVRYEGEMVVENHEGDAVHRKTYVLRARQPERDMTCYVEARKDDDLDRIFRELADSCHGGTVRPESRRELYTDQEGVIVVGLVIDFDAEPRE